MNEEQPQKLLDIVETFSDDIKMEFGLDKCAKFPVVCCSQQ